MSTFQAILAFAAFLSLVSIMCATSFVAMVVSNAVKARPEIAPQIRSDLLDAVSKVSRLTFNISAGAAIILYPFAALALLALAIMGADSIFG